MSAPLRLAVVGAKGRVGSAVVRLAGEHGMTVTRAVGREGGTTALSAGDFDVVVDFSSPDLLPDLAALAVAARTPLVSGTTGLSRDGERALEHASHLIPVLWEPNLSVGVHVLGTLLRRAIEALGESFDVEIVETHHRAKVDAPSGTALRLAAIAEEALGGGKRKSGAKAGPVLADRARLGSMRFAAATSSAITACISSASANASSSSTARRTATFSLMGLSARPAGSPADPPDAMASKT